MAATTKTTPAILLRRVNYGDYDLILTLLTLSEGKVSVMAKSAKKSVKRFGGALELFSLVNVVFSSGRKSGLPMLQEAALVEPLSNIRSDIRKTAYASYWSEIIHMWMLEGKKEERLYHLIHLILEELNAGTLPDALLSLVFQSRFLSISGLRPNLEQCMQCGEDIDRVKSPFFSFDPRRGGLFCNNCDEGPREKPILSKGTLKLLTWIEGQDFDHVRRIRFSPRALQEAQRFLEAVIPCHLGKMPKSLVFLQKIRTMEGSEK
jgi:DNA repair protein RecO (recombination protein O)